MDQEENNNPVRSYYQSYLLRLWQSGGRNRWHASLQDVATGENQLFSTLSSLVDYLHRQTGCEQGEQASLGDQENLTR